MQKNISFLIIFIILFSTTIFSGCIGFGDDIRVYVIECHYKSYLAYGMGLMVRLKIENHKDEAIIGSLTLVMEDGTTLASLSNLGLTLQVPANDYIIHEAWFPTASSTIKPKSISFTVYENSNSYTTYSAKLQNCSI